MQLDRPLPHPTPVTAPFWQGLADGEVRIQHCSDCSGWVFYPRSRCSHCLSDALEWRAVSGAGTLYTFTVARVPTSPHFAADVPQYLAVVELDEGVRLTTTLVDGAAHPPEVGMRVAPVFERVGEDSVLLRYRRA